MKKNFWTKPRKDVPRAYLILGTVAVAALIGGGWISIALLVAGALGVLLGIFMYLSRPENL